MRNAISPRLAISTFSNITLMPSPPFRGEREGTRRFGDGEGEVGRAVTWSCGGVPHLTPTLSAPKGGEGDFKLPADRFQHTPNIFHYFPIPKSDSPGSLAGRFRGCVTRLRWF